MNGVLAKFHTNNQSIETQLMRKFLKERDINRLSPPAESEDLFTSNSSSLHDDNWNLEVILKLQALAECSNLNSDYSLPIASCSIIHLLPPLYKKVLSISGINNLKAVYSYIYTDINIEYFSLFCITSKKCIIADELFTSSFITAFWPTESLNMPEHELQVGRIQKFLKHTIKVRIKCKVHIFGIIEWYMKHHNSDYYGTSAIMCTPLVYAASVYQFMPVQRIFNYCAHAKLNVSISNGTDHHEEVIMAISIHFCYSL